MQDCGRMPSSKVSAFVSQFHRGCRCCWGHTISPCDLCWTSDTSGSGGYPTIHRHYFVHRSSGPGYRRQVYLILFNVFVIWLLTIYSPLQPFDYDSYIHGEAHKSTTCFPVCGFSMYWFHYRRHSPLSSFGRLGRRFGYVSWMLHRSHPSPSGISIRVGNHDFSLPAVSSFRSRPRSTQLCILWSRTGSIPHWRSGCYHTIRKWYGS